MPFAGNDCDWVPAGLPGSGRPPEALAVREQPRPKQTWRETRRLIGCDIDLYSQWPLGFGMFKKSRPRWMLFLYLLCTFHMFPAIVLFRLQAFLYDAGFGPLASGVSRLNHFLFSVSIGNQVRSTGGLVIAHGHVVVDGWTLLGHDVQLNPFVTLGVTNSVHQPFVLWGPTIGDHVSIGTGAKILGPVWIGDHAKIGANAVVVHDVPAHHTAVGVPAHAFPTEEVEGETE